MDADEPLCGDRRAPRVLIAEDNPALAQVTKFNLERAGYQVALACDGQEGWQAVQQEAFDVVIMDHQMPRMTGWQLCERMRAAEAHARTPILFLTAKCLEMDRSRLESELGVGRVLGKPFSPRQMVETVGELLAASRRSA